MQRLMFQSAPPTEAGGDTWPCCRSRQEAPRFNPLPPPKQGEIAVRHVGISFQEIIGDLAIRGFNPLPPPKQGEMGGPLQDCRSVHRRFNPLPPPKQGEIALRILRATGMIVFNPLPPPKQGEMLPR